MNCMSLFSCATDKKQELDFNNLSVIFFTSNAIKKAVSFKTVHEMSLLHIL